MSRKPCEYCHKPSTLSCPDCPINDQTYYCSTACYKRDSRENFHRHKIWCRVKQAYARFRLLDWPDDANAINAILDEAGAGLGAKIGIPGFKLAVPNEMKAYLMNVPPEKRGAGTAGTDGIAGVESRSLMIGLQVVGRFDPVEHLTRSQMLQKGKWKDTPEHLVPITQRLIRKFPSEDGDSEHSYHIQLFPSDYDMYSFDLYMATFAWKLKDPDNAYTQDPWARMRAYRDSWMPHSTPDAIEEAVRHEATKTMFKNTALHYNMTEEQVKDKFVEKMTEAGEEARLNLGERCCGGQLIVLDKHGRISFMPREGS